MIQFKQTRKKNSDPTLLAAKTNLYKHIKSFRSPAYLIIAKVSLFKYNMTVIRDNHVEFVFIGTLHSQAHTYVKNKHSRIP